MVAAAVMPDAPGLSAFPSRAPPRFVDAGLEHKENYIQTPVNDRGGPRMISRHVKPQRVQLRRSKGWHMPPGTVKVDRTTLFGNPFPVKEYGHDRAVELHHAWMTGKPTGGLADAGIPGGRME